LKNIFVIMPFSSTASRKETEWTDIYERVFKPAITDCGYSCERASPETGSLIKSIIERLKKSHIVLADLTDKNPNVLYELGVRHSISKRTIIVAQKIDDIPSDLQGYWHLRYLPDRIDQFKIDLKDILQKIERDPDKSDSPVSDYQDQQELRRHKNVDEMLQKVEEFSAYEIEQTNHKKLELNLIKEPIHVYEDPDPERDIKFGAVFAFALGTNPEVLITFESYSHGISFELVRIGGAEMHVIWNKEEIWVSDYGDGRTSGNPPPNSYISILYDDLVSGKFKINKGKIDTEQKKKSIPITLLKEIPNKIGKDGAKMVLIPAGDFEMGTDPSEIPKLVKWARELKQHSGRRYNDAESEWFMDETPHHVVYLDAFYMDIYEATNAQYKEFIDATGRKAPIYWNDLNAPNHPVVGVSWDDANAYSKWAGKRLPTEAEWEKAARGGLVRKRFPWGDEDPDDTRCNFEDKSITPVGSYPPNGYGLYDMGWNVREWCADWYDKGYYEISLRKNPQGPNSGDTRVLRGRSWGDFHPRYIRVSSRSHFGPSGANPDVGFRCVGLEVTP